MLRFQLRRCWFIRWYSLVMIAGFVVLSGNPAAAQRYTSLHDFTELSETGTNVDGARSRGGLSLSGGVLYGTTVDGGSFGRGTVFKMNADGTDFTTLHSFATTPLPGPTPPPNSNNEGANPRGGVIISNNVLYGTALAGGPLGFGTVFKINTDGTGFSVLHAFSGSNLDGNSPQGSLLLVGETLYGATAGNVFRVNTDGTGFSIVRAFGAFGADPIFGLDPSHCGLALAGNTLYGSTVGGGSSYGMPEGSAGSGTVFAVDTDGSNFRVVHNFAALDEQTNTNLEGYNPLGTLVLAGNALYGTTAFGGMFTRGTVFKVNTDGTGFMILHTFPQLVNFLNSDGANPSAGLFLSGNTLYGTTPSGGAAASGTIFSISVAGTGFKNLYNFNNGLGGGSDSPVILSGGVLYGSSPAFPSGNIFSLAPARADFDYEGDGKSDISVFRPSDGNWYLQQSTDGFYAVNFGIATDRIVPADYDGDGKTDVAVYRPSTGIWYVVNSSDGTFSSYGFGVEEDLPAPADYDGDGKADVAVFRPSTGTWYRQNSSDGSFFAEQFGISIDKIVPADYDGDGKTDIAIYRPADGLWYVKNSGNGTYTPYIFGLAEDIPVPGDYDGDGKADIAVFRPSDGTWYIANSSNSSFTIFPWGQDGDRPTPGAFGN